MVIGDFHCDGALWYVCRDFDFYFTRPIHRICAKRRYDETYEFEEFGVKVHFMTEQYFMTKSHLAFAGHYWARGIVSNRCGFDVVARMGELFKAVANRNSYIECVAKENMLETLKKGVLMEIKAAWRAQKAIGAGG